MLRISWLFCIFRYSPANKVWKPKRGKFSNKDMAQKYKIFQKFTLLWGLQNLIFWKDTAKVFMRVSLSGFIRYFHLSI